MNILLISPFPPPYNGQSLASGVLYDYLSSKENISCIDFSKKNRCGIFSFLIRILEVLKNYSILLKKRNEADLIYITISESVMGSLKDFITYILIFKKLHKTVLHLHGGAGMNKLLSKKRYLLIRFFNQYFFSRSKAIIVLGETQKIYFQKIVNNDKIKIVGNFADDYLFLDPNSYDSVKLQKNKIEILFLSNLILSKGYRFLIDAFTQLPKEISDLYILNIAGEIRDENTNRYIHNLTSYNKNIIYHGVVDGENKKLLLQRSQIFCLPTYYEFEGQPISILEAYAAGCFVLVTNHSGIKDIFMNKKNGYFIEKKSEESIIRILTKLVDLNKEIKSVGIGNIWYAKEKFRKMDYCESVYSILKY